MGALRKGKLKIFDDMVDMLMDDTAIPEEGMDILIEDMEDFGIRRRRVLMKVKVNGQFNKMDNNLEGAKVELVVNQLENLKKTISVCYGMNPYPGSDFSDKEMGEIYYKANNYALSLTNRKVRDLDKDEEV